MSDMSSPSAIDKTLMVLDAVLEHSRFTDVVNATGLAKSTVHRIMASLVEHEFVAQADDGSYHPGPKALRLAGHALTNVDLATVARPVLADLVAQTRCTVHVGLLNGDEAIYVARLDGPKPYRMPSRVGKAIWLHCTGIGKALLAEKDEEELDVHITRTGLPARTPLTHTTAAALKTDLAQVRARGYALDDEENEPGIRCVAAVIHDHTGAAVAAVSISTLSLEQSIAQVALMAPAAIEAARKISAALGYREPTN